jgi:exo-1,4-beta-D-glucosaminidase
MSFLLLLASAANAERVDLTSGWKLKSSVLVKETDAVVATERCNARDWLPVTVPSTVLNALVKAGIYPDLRIGLNAYQIPDSSDEFNQQHDLAKFSYLPDKRNPWRDPYWYRTEFTLRPGKRVWLHFDAINYRADVWLNGKQIANRDTMAGMFQRFQFDITDIVRRGRNVLAVKVYPVDHPGKPGTQLEVFGKVRAEHTDLERDVTEIKTTGYDCMMTVPDRNMGLWQNVWLEFTGPVDIRDPFVVTDLPLPETNRATLAVSAELVNATDAPVKGVLRGSIAGTDVQFSRPVELAANATKTVTIDPKPVIRNPRLWWPVNYGEQHLYELKLEFAGTERTVTFGVRRVTTEIHEINGWHGRRVLVNGQKIFCRGGYIQPELLFDWDTRRMETEIRYYAQANLNLIYFEDIPNPPSGFLELCDRYGLLFGNCFYSCYWQKPVDDFALLERCTVDLVKRYRNHPSLIMYMTMNEGTPSEPVYEMWRRHVLALDGTRWFIPSGTFADDRKNVPEYFKKDLPAGMNDARPKSYGWEEPTTYFQWVRDSRNWMFMMESGTAAVPPMSSLNKFISEHGGGASTNPYPLNATWAHHGANFYYKPCDVALRRLHGEPESVTDYCWKQHLVTADQNRAMFEAVNHRLWDITSGFTQWKINSCEPSIQWQIFDWYLKPMVSWFYIKKACEPLHVQLNAPDRMVSVINTRLAPQTGLEVRARVFNLESKLCSEKTVRLDVPANSYREAFVVALAESPVSFVKLELKDVHGRLVSENFYWLGESLKPLQTLPLVKLQTEWKMGRAIITNPTDHIAFFVQLALTKGKRGEEVLPVLWSDNYFSLLPHESRQITATIPDGIKPELEVGGWNIETDFDCTDLRIERDTVTATVANTFLDGSRVTLYVDGKPADSKWAWARGKKTDTVKFSIPAGKHEIKIGRR